MSAVAAAPQRRSETFHRALAVVPFIVASCAGASARPRDAGPSRDKEAVMQGPVRARVTVDGKAGAEIEVALTDAGGEVLAAARSDAAGLVTLTPHGGGAPAFVLARLHTPIAGALVAPVGSAGAVVELSAATASAVSLELAIQPPPGVTFDWADVSASPRAAPGLPAELIGAASVDGAGPARRATYHTVRAAQPRTRLLLLPGTWDIKVEHVVERPSMPFGAPANWTGAELTVDGGAAIPARSGAHRIDLTRPTSATVTTRVTRD